jgi:hypothetical protein
MAAIRFYLRSVIWECDEEWHSLAHGITNHLTLLDQLRNVPSVNEPVLLVTFNYDRILERALLSVDVSISTLADYIQHDTFKLFKLHGSVHWAREIKNEFTNINDRDDFSIITDIINSAKDINITDRFGIVGSILTGKIDDIPMFPAIAIPVETKLNFECPQSHLNELCSHLEKVTKILTVGWAAQERHFLKLLKDNLTDIIRVQVVAGTEVEAGLVVDRLKHSGINLVAEPHVAGFTEYVLSRDAERFFAT